MFPVAAVAAGRFDAEAAASVEVTWVSELVVRGLERGEQAVVTSLTGNTGAWRAALAATVDPGREGRSEWRAEAGWGRDLAGQLAVEASLAATMFSRPPAGSTRESIELGISASWQLPREVAVTLAGFHDFRLEANTVEAAVTWSVPLTRIGAYLDLRAVAGWSHAQDWRPRAPGPAIAGGYGYVGAAAEVPYRIGAYTSLVAGVAYSEVWNARDAGVLRGPNGRRNLVGRIGVSFDF